MRGLLLIFLRLNQKNHVENPSNVYNWINNTGGLTSNSILKKKNTMVMKIEEGCVSKKYQCSCFHILNSVLNILGHFNVIENWLISSCSGM